MAYRLPRACSVQGCPGIVREQVCSTCGPIKRPEDRRGSSAERGYGGAWQRLRARYLLRHPLCERCKAKGLTVPAIEVHHVRYEGEGKRRTLVSMDDLESLCRACHESTKQRGGG